MHSWYKTRHYLHFDTPIGEAKATKIVESPSQVARHSFFPFICYVVTAKKITKSENGIQYKEKKRPIAFASHVDSHIYSYYTKILSDLYEVELSKLGIEKSVLAFRKLGKSNIDFALDAFNNIKEKGPCTAIAFDISGFFDNLDHQILKQRWIKLLGDQEKLPNDHFAVFKSVTKFSVVNRNDLALTLEKAPSARGERLRKICSPEEFRNVVRRSKLIKTNINDRGIPQGSPISAVLSNIYMLEFDKYISDVIEEQGGSYYRYCDDMLFIVPTEWKKNIATLVRREIKKLGIDINANKTEIRDFSRRGNRLMADKPLQYLGFMFDGNQITIRSAAFARYSARMKSAIKSAKRKRKKENIKRINNGRPIENTFYKKKIFENYSHLGRRNFIRYGLRSADIMGSKAIRRQMKPLWDRLIREISD